MFCPKCGKELPEGSTICSNCETSETNVEPKQEAPKASNTTTENTSDTVTVKKSKKPLAIIISLFLIIALGVFGVYYFISSNSPKKVFNSLIDNSFKALEKDYKLAEDVTTQNTTMKLQFGIDTEITELKEIAKVLEQLEIEFNVQIDYEEKLATVNFDSSLDNEDLLKLQCYMDTEKEEAYIYAEQLFDKYLKTTIDKEIIELLKESFKVPSNTENDLKALKIAKNELKSLLPEDNFTKENEKLKINNNTVNVKKHTLELSGVETLELLKNYYEALLDNKEFIEAFENDKDREMIEESLEDLIDDVQYSLKNLEETPDDKLEISIYTKGFTNEFVKFEAYIHSENFKTGFEVLKHDKENYNYKLVVEEDNKKQEIDGTCKIIEKDNEEVETTIKVNIPEVGEFSVEFTVSNILNKDIDEINTSNNVDIENLTDEDIKKIEENLQKMKIYELIEPLFASQQQELINSIDKATTEYEKSAQETEEKLNELQNQLDSYMNENSTTNTQPIDTTTIDRTTSSKINDNQIISYDNKKLIEFNIPTGYASKYYISDNYRTFAKSNSYNTITINTDRNTTSSKYTALQNSLKYFEDEYYTDVKLSDTQTIDVNGKTIYYNTITYTYNSDSQIEHYYYTPISDNYIFCIEFDNNELSEEELKAFLTINVSDYNEKQISNSTNSFDTANIIEKGNNFVN